MKKPLLIVTGVVFLALAYYGSFKLFIPRLEWPQIPDGMGYVYGCDSTLARQFYYPCALMEVTLVHPNQRKPYFCDRRYFHVMAEAR